MNTNSRNVVDAMVTVQVIPSSLSVHCSLFTIHCSPVPHSPNVTNTFDMAVSVYTCVAFEACEIVCTVFYDCADIEPPSMLYPKPW